MACGTDPSSDPWIHNIIKHPCRHLVLFVPPQAVSGGWTNDSRATRKELRREDGAVNRERLVREDSEKKDTLM